MQEEGLQLLMNYPCITINEINNDHNNGYEDNDHRDDDDYDDNDDDDYVDNCGYDYDTDDNNGGNDDKGINGHNNV